MGCKNEKVAFHLNYKGQIKKTLIIYFDDFNNFNFSHNSKRYLEKQQEIPTLNELKFYNFYT